MAEDFGPLDDGRKALQGFPAPQPDLEGVIRRARALRIRRSISAGVVTALVAAGVLVPLGSLGLLDRPVDERRTPAGEGTPEPSVSPTTATTPEAGPVLDFEPAAGWYVVTTDPSLAGQPGAPQAWAANVPFSEADRAPGVSNVYPGGYPEQTIRTMPPDGIVILSSFPIETRNPLSPRGGFPARTLPLRLEQPPSSGWEGQPREDLSTSGVRATVNGWWVNVRAYFGTADPSDALIDEANDEVARLIIPPPPPTTEAFDQFGIRMERPEGWYGSLTAWPSSPLVLETSSVPINDLYDGTSARRALGQDDLFIVLTENLAAADQYEPVTLPISIRPDEDACLTCEVNDNGSSPPAGHTLFYRSFATAGREFDLWVEFGTAGVSTAQIARANDVLSTFVVEPLGPPNSVEPPASPAPRAPVYVELPAGWVEKPDPVPAAVDPRVVAGWGTWDFPTGGGCGPEPALGSLPSDGAFVWVVEHADPGYGPDFEPGGAPSSIDLQTPPARWRCGAAAPSRHYLFSESGRYLELFVALGPGVSDQTIAQAEDLLASFTAEPPSRVLARHLRPRLLSPSATAAKDGHPPVGVDDMSLREAMETQRAIRRLTADPVDDEVLMRCLSLAVRAPTGGNAQNWEWIVVRDPHVKAGLARLYRQSWSIYGRLARRAMRGRAKMGRIIDAVQWQVDRLEEVPVLVVPCLRGSIRPIAWPFFASSHYGSIYPAIQNFLLACRAEGLGASLTTLPVWSTVLARRVLGLPFRIQPVAVIPVGWPRGRYGPTSRKPVHRVVHLDRWGNRPARP